MLKKIRVAVSLALFVLITFYFLDFAELLPLNFKFLAEIQFIPALLSLNVIVLVLLVVLTLLFGRVYCSSICPMGVYQDIAAWLSKKFRKNFVKTQKIHLQSGQDCLRWTVLVPYSWHSCLVYIPCRAS